MRIFVIGDPDTVAGMRLAGASGHAASDREEVGAVLEAALEDGDFALVLITRDRADLLRERVDGLKTERLKPLVVEIPSRDGDLPVPRAAEIIRSAVGLGV